MQKQTHTNGTHTPSIDLATELGSNLADAAKDGAKVVVAQTEKSVKKYPLGAIGVALGSGIVLGVVGTRMFTPRKKNVFERLGVMAFAAAATKGLAKLF